METNPIPYYFDSINRNAILVRPKTPFYDWLSKTFVDDKPPAMDEHNIYLIREMDSNEDAKKWVKKNFDKLFVNELNDWCVDEQSWPTNRTFKIFSDWFEVEVHSMVLDLEEFPVTKE